MRITKFRVWNEEAKEMNHQGSNTTKDNRVMDCIIKFDEGIRVFTRYFEEQSWKDIPNFKLMQSTGLKDKNGKEIFEGDIICWNNIYGLKEFALYRDKFVTVVKWLDGGLVIEDDGFNYNMSASQNIEIIGNIYENSDLLT